MIKKVFKWIGIIILVLVAGASIVTASRQNVEYEAPYPAIHASADPLTIARGKHLVYGAAHCADCHGNGNKDSLMAIGSDIPLSGGYKFVLPVGNIYARNITPDKETGIGKYTDPQIARALRYGVHPNGTAVFDFMPFHNMSDEDLTAVISFLRSQKPVYHRVPDHDPNMMGYIVKAFFVKPVGPTGKVPVSVKKDTSADYGKYLAMHIANCQGCHTQRDMSGAYTGPLFAGGSAMNGLIPPNLTSDPSGRLYAWSQKQFIDRFHRGKIIAQSEMPWNSFKNMDDDELKALYHFLKSLPPAKNKEKPVSR